jgi:DNA-binding transcriptional ArsR family regulator
MVEFRQATDESNLDAVFAALADPTRRAVLASLSEGSHSVTELAGPHSMSLPGFMKHLRVLEEAGLVARSKNGRVVCCTLSPRPMKEAAAWLSHYERFWKEGLDRLDDYLRVLQERERKKMSDPEGRKT